MRIGPGLTALCLSLLWACGYELKKKESDTDQPPKSGGDDLTAPDGRSETEPGKAEAGMPTLDMQQRLAASLTHSPIAAACQSDFFKWADIGGRVDIDACASSLPFDPKRVSIEHEITTYAGQTAAETDIIRIELSSDRSFADLAPAEAAAIADQFRTLTILCKPDLVVTDISFAQNRGLDSASCHMRFSEMRFGTDRDGRPTRGSTERKIIAATLEFFDKDVQDGGIVSGKWRFELNDGEVNEGRLAAAVKLQSQTIPDPGPGVLQQDQ